MAASAAALYFAGLGWVEGTAKLAVNDWPTATAVNFKIDWFKFSLYHQHEASYIIEHESYVVTFNGRNTADAKSDKCYTFVIAL